MELNSVEREVEREEFRAPAQEGHLQIGHGNVNALLPKPAAARYSKPAELLQLQ